MSAYSMFAQHRSRQPRRVVLLSTLAFFALCTVGYFARSYTAPARPFISSAQFSPPRKSTHHLPAFCEAVNVSNIAVSVKTSATELLNKLSAQLITSLRCVPDPLIFSDLDQTIGSHEIHDALSSVSPEIIETNPDFDVYLEQKRLHAQSYSVDLGKSEIFPSRGPVDGDQNAITIDALDTLAKYKTIAMVTRAWELQPGRDWYIFIEADTYLSLPSLARWLGGEDPSERLYVGNPVRPVKHSNSSSFTQGGSGFVLSGAAVRDFALSHQTAAARLNSTVKDYVYGESALAAALQQELDIEVIGSPPKLVDLEPALIPFNEEVWCQSAVALRHVDIKQLDDIYKYEKAQGFSRILFRDIYAALHSAGLPFQAQSWDNFSDDEKYALKMVPNNPDRIFEVSDPRDLVDPHSSYLACEIACTQNERCLQYSLVSRLEKIASGDPEFRSTCYLSTVFRRGKALIPGRDEPGRIVASGWQSERIEKWVEKHQSCPESG